MTTCVCVFWLKDWGYTMKFKELPQPLRLKLMMRLISRPNKDECKCRVIALFSLSGPDTEMRGSPSRADLRSHFLKLHSPTALCSRMCVKVATSTEIKCKIICAPGNTLTIWKAQTSACLRKNYLFTHLCQM